MFDVIPTDITLDSNPGYSASPFPAMVPATSAFLKISVLAGGMLLACPVLPGQDAPPPQATASPPASIPVKLDISRRSLKNFLTDETALSPYRSPDGTIGELTGLFMIGSGSVPYAVFWDSLSCRLLGVLDITRPGEAESVAPLPPSGGDETVKTAPSPYVLKASGPAQFSGPTGSPATPVYFGFRLIDGKPEFLYTSGPLAVEERIWLEEGGTLLKQRFSVRDAAKGFRILLPAEWKERVAVSAGTWKNETLTVPAEAAGEVILTYRLTDREPEPAVSN